MTLREVLGQPHAIETLRRGLSRGKLHHALLFAGPEGVGKELTAFALACAIVCTTSPGEGCGTCSACHRATTLSSEGAAVPLHPDVILVARGLYGREILGRSTEEKTDISVDQIRRVVLERAHLAPHEAPQRIVIIRAADELSVGAANALLKTLEEPPPHTRFVLITAQPGELLPTILSRTQLLRFAPLTDALIEKLLIGRGIDATTAKRVAPLAAGSASVATTLADPTLAEARSAAVEALREAASGKLSDTLETTSSYANTGEARVALAAHLRALAAEEAGEVRSLVLGGGSERDIERALARRDGAIALVDTLAKNANVPLALEAAWLHLRRR
jgi:DNA polymerase-3 subunit delta'